MNTAQLLRWLALLSLGALTACAPVASPTVTYACESGVQLALRFEREAALATLPGGQTVVLPQQPSASGFWYAGQGHVLRGKGREAQWTSGAAEPLSCLQVGP